LKGRDGTPQIRVLGPENQEVIPNFDQVRRFTSYLFNLTVMQLELLTEVTGDSYLETGDASSGHDCLPSLLGDWNK
jgi:hypothetical protein